jgi:hypothetical protein
MRQPVPATAQAARASPLVPNPIIAHFPGARQGWRHRSHGPLISTGPFGGIVAEIVEMDEKDRLVVLIDMPNRSTRLMLHSDTVSPV